MKMLWCWRCRMEVPMLNDEEFKIAAELYSGARFRKGSIKERMQPVVDYYEKLTGVRTIPNAIMHHQLSQYGPECEKCGKPYRTPQASFCAACGNKR